MIYFMKSTTKCMVVAGVFLIGLWVNYVDLILVPLDFDQCYALVSDNPPKRFLSPEHPATWTIRQHVFYGLNATNRWSAVIGACLLTLPAMLVLLSKRTFWRIGFSLCLIALLFFLQDYVFPDLERNLHHDCDRKGTMSGFVLIFTLIYLPASFALLGFVKLLRNAFMRT